MEPPLPTGEKAAKQEGQRSGHSRQIWPEMRHLLPPSFHPQRTVLPGAQEKDLLLIQPPKKFVSGSFFRWRQNPFRIPVYLGSPSLQVVQVPHGQPRGFSERGGIVHFVSQQQLCSQNRPDQVQQEEERRASPPQHPHSSCSSCFRQKKEDLRSESGSFLLSEI